MKPPRKLLVTTLIASSTSPLLGEVTWDGGAADDLWSTPENWSDDSVPTAGNVYLAEGVTVVSPDTDATSFDGDTLALNNGAILNLYRTNGGAYLTVTHSLPGLALSDSEIRPQSSLGSVGHVLDSPVDLAGANVLNMNENSAYTMRMFFNGPLSGSGSLEVTRDTTGSTRSFQFTGDASTYTGDVSFAGVGESDTMIFDVDNAAGWGSGTLTVGDHARLNLNTAVANPAATLALTGPNAVVEVPVDGVSLGSLTQDGGEIALDLTNPGSGPVADAITLAGDFNANGGKITLDVAELPLTDTPYTLVRYAGSLSGNPAIEVVDTVNSTFTTSIDYGSGSDSAITVTFAEFTGMPDELVWTGLTDDTWDVETTANWSDGGAPSTFSPFDHVTFDDSVGDGFPEVLLDTTVTPGSVDIAADSTEYLIRGSGTIGGTGILTKTGGSLAIIATDNTYDGGTDILGGVLQVGNGGTTGSLGTNSVINDALLSFHRSDTHTFPNVVNGTGDLEQSGPGTLVLTGFSSYTGTTTVSGGTLQVGDGSSNAQNLINTSAGLIVRGGTVLDLPRLHAGSAQQIALSLPPVTLADGATLRFRAQTGSNVWNIDASTSLTVDGSVLISATGGGYNHRINHAGTLAGSGRIEYRTTDSPFAAYDKLLDLSAADSPYTGDWLVEHVATGDDFGTLQASAPDALGSGTVTLSTRAKLVNRAEGGLDSLAGVVLDHEDARLVNHANTSVTGLSGSLGSVEAAAGTLTLAAPGIPDGGDVLLATGATLELGFTGTDTIRSLVVDGLVQATGTWGAAGSGAQHETPLITGDGLLEVVGSDPYLAWIDGFFPGESDPAIVGRDADPDHDGDRNEVEFATNGDPSRGAASGKVAGVVGPLGGDLALTLTLPVRSGAVFGGATEQVAQVDGLTYRIQGSDDLGDWTSIVISEVVPALSAGLPSLDAGWEYRTFRTPGPVGDRSERFLRANFDAASATP